jgi:hypothetical protein
MTRLPDQVPTEDRRSHDVRDELSSTESPRLHADLAEVGEERRVLRNPNARVPLRAFETGQKVVGRARWEGHEPRNRVRWQQRVLRERRQQSPYVERRSSNALYGAAVRIRIERVRGWEPEGGEVVAVGLNA